MLRSHWSENLNIYRNIRDICIEKLMGKLHAMNPTRLPLNYEGVLVLSVLPLYAARVFHNICTRPLLLLDHEKINQEEVLQQEPTQNDSAKSFP